MMHLAIPQNPIEPSTVRALGFTNPRNSRDRQTARRPTPPRPHASTFGLAICQALLANCFKIERDLDVFSDEHAAGLECGVPGQSEFLPIDRGLPLEADDFVAPW
jgi:hypothetical protein